MKPDPMRDRSAISYGELFDLIRVTVENMVHELDVFVERTQPCLEDYLRFPQIASKTRERN